MSKITSIIFGQLKVRTPTDTWMEVDPKTDLRIDRGNVDIELAHNAMLFAWYGTLHDVAVRDVARLKKRIEKRKSFLAERIRSKHAPGSGRLTNATIDARMSSDEKLDELEDRLIETEYRTARLKTLREAFKEAGENLREINRGDRKQWRGESEFDVLKARAAEKARNRN